MKSLLRGSLLLVNLIFLSIKSDSGVSSQINSPQIEIEQNKSYWTIFDSPSYTSLNKIFMSSANHGIIGGRVLIEYSNRAWNISKSQPPSLRVTDIFAASEKNIWVTNNTPSNLSELFHFDGVKWEQVYQPLANTVTAMVNSEKGNNIEWLGGDRELVHKKNNSWKFLPFPTSSGSITYIFPEDEDIVWVQVSKTKLFRFDGFKWTQFFNNDIVSFVYFDSPSHGFVLINDKLYERNGLNFSLHSQSNLLKQVVKLDIINKNDIWGIGLSGLVLHYYQNKWHKELIPTIEDLYDIKMLTPNEGWVVGNNGIILHYSTSKKSNKQNQALGFNSIKIITTSKEIMDEYGVAMDDLNNDGLKDVYTVCIFDPNRLYINHSILNNEGKVVTLNFLEESRARNTTGISGDTSSSNFRELDLGVGLGDVDNDGDLDIYLCNLLGTNKLLLNDGKGYFRDVSKESNRGIGKNERTNAAIFGDVDNDGDLDLFITNEESTNRLYLNDGNGYFTEVTQSAGLTTTNGGTGAAFGDIDGDGKLDIYVTNWSAPNILYHNESSKENGIKFKNITASSSVAGEPFAKSNGVCFADIDNDGDLDLFVTNRKLSNRLYLNDGKGNFTDITESYIGLDSMLSYGATFGDFDQDGYQDLYVANVGENVLYKNIGGRKFILVTAQFGAQMTGYCTGSACGDVDNDGDLDLYVASYITGNSILFINNINNHNFIKFKIEGTISNRDAIGTKISLYKSGHSGDQNYLIGYREISGGSGYGSYNSREVHFGVKDSIKYDAVISFPASGIKRILNNISAGSLYFINEEEGLAGSLTIFSKYIKRFFLDPQVHFETYKFLIVLIIFILSGLWGHKRYGWGKNHQFTFHGTTAILYWIQIWIFMYKGFFLDTILPLIFVLVSLSILHLIYERVIMVRINRLEKQATRDRIARDLHDDLASTLSSSAIYTEALKRSLKELPKEGANLIEKINSLLVEASEAVTDIVWTVSPFNDTLDDLILRLKTFISDCCRIKEIEYKVGIYVEKANYKIHEELRRNIYLIFKEALNNIIKHSSAKFVRFDVEVNKNILKMILEDDGNGFSKDDNFIFSPSVTSLINIKTGSAHGNGLKNMYRRAEEIKAKLDIDSSPGNGTKISLTYKMTKIDY
ncbi:MAG: FG-GAP-like repeat-containing protein [Bacteroidetes bacterium]|nr:FG-GAP-like repeat-containing protein [Bacteroidota bacterium]